MGSKLSNLNELRNILTQKEKAELYQIRWSIEVLNKECKQYLRLGKSQNTDFYGQIADASLIPYYRFINPHCKSLQIIFSL